MERDKVQEELEREVKSLKKQMASAEQEAEQQRSSLEEQIATLQETLSEVSLVPNPSSTKEGKGLVNCCGEVVVLYLWP